MSQPAIPSDPMTEFRENVVKKLREDIRDMLPQSALDELVKRAVDEEFFKQRERVDNYGRRIAAEPSWFVQKVAEKADAAIHEEVEKFLKANASVIEKALSDFLTAEKLTLLAAGMIGARITENFSATAFSIVEQMKRPY